MKFSMFRKEKGIHILPEIEDVFVGDYDRCRKAFFPICSIDLRVLDSGLAQKLHLVYFNNDTDNDAAATHFTTYCTIDSLGFDVVGDKYRFQADFGYFDMTPDWVEWYDQTCSSYAALKERVREEGAADLVNQLQPGGEPLWLQEDATPLDPSGRPMRFILQYNSMLDIDDMCGRDVYLFYSAEHRLAVQVVQNT